MNLIRELLIGVAVDVDSTDLNTLDQELKTIDEGFRKVKETGQRWTATITAAFLALSVGGAKAASDAKETSSKFGEVFDEIIEQAHRTSEALQRDYFLAQSTAEGMLSGTALLLQSLGLTAENALSLTDEVIRRAADVSSFRNVVGGTQAVVEALTAALIGERERLASLTQVKITEAQVTNELTAAEKRLTGQSLQAAKAQATLRLFMQATTKDAGDVARTANEVANQFRFLSEEVKGLAEEFGENLEPVTKLLLSTGRALVRWLRDLPELIQTLIIAVGALVAAMGPLLMVIGLLGPHIEPLYTAIMVFGPSVLAAAMPFIKLAAVITAVLSLVEDFYTFLVDGKSLIGDLLAAFGVEEQAREKLLWFFGSLIEMFGELWNLGKALIGVVVDLVVKLLDMAAAGLGLSGAFEIVLTILRGIGVMVDWLTDKIDAMVSGLRGAVDAVESFDAVGFIGDVFGNVGARLFGDTERRGTQAGAMTTTTIDQSVNVGSMSASATVAPGDSPVMAAMGLQDAQLRQVRTTLAGAGSVR